MPTKYTISVTQTVELDLDADGGNDFENTTDPSDPDVRGMVYNEFMMRVVNGQIDDDSIKIEKEQ